MLLLILTGLFTAAFIILYKALAERQNYWKNRGVLGPEPSLLLGNLMELTEPDIPANYRFMEWTKKYGKNYGIVDGWQRILVSADVNVLHDVFVNKFDSFHGRKLIPFAENPDTSTDVHVFAARGARWKRLRAISSPSFSVSSLKKVMPTLVDSIHVLVDEMERRHAKTGIAFNIHSFYQELTIDVICRIALGQKGSQMFHNPLFKDVKNFFERSARHPIMFTSKILPPVFAPLIRKTITLAAKIHYDPVKVLQKQMAAAVEDRKRNRTAETPSVDFIDLFLDAEADVTDAKSGFEIKQHIKVERKLTEDEIKANCFLFLIAGYDTTSNALAYSSFYIAHNPDVLKRLQEEVDEICVNKEISYEQTKQLSFMDKVIREALRLHPLAAIANTRLCMEDAVVGDGVKIQKGTYVAADVYSVHHDKSLWGEDADKFRPDRWDAGLPHPMAWLPFGAGPRICIGMRLALLEAKLALAYILRKFDIVTCSQSEEKLTCHGAATIAPDSVTVQLRSRAT